MNATLDYVQVTIPGGQSERARRFYSGVLALPELPLVEDPADQVVSSYQVGPVQLRVVMDPDFKPRTTPLFRLIVSDLEQFEGRLRDFGIDFGPVIRPSGPSCIRFNDPFGNRLELGSEEICHGHLRRAGELQH
jgi:hypothetical protein